MNTIKTRMTDKGVVYFQSSNGKILTDIKFIEYEKFEGLYTVNKVNGEFYTYLPKPDGDKTYLRLSKIIELGNVVYFVN